MLDRFQPSIIHLVRLILNSHLKSLMKLWFKQYLKQKSKLTNSLNLQRMLFWMNQKKKWKIKQQITLDSKTKSQMFLTMTEFSNIRRSSMKKSSKFYKATQMAIQNLMQNRYSQINLHNLTTQSQQLMLANVIIKMISFVC